MTNSPDMIGSALRVGLLGLAIWSVARVWMRRRQPAVYDDEPEPGEPDLCAHCGYDVRGGLDRCPECGRPTLADQRRRLADLRTRWPTETFVPRVRDPAERPVVVLRTDVSAAARLLRRQLEARGIAAWTAGPKPTGGPAHVGPAPGGHRLIVWSADEERARAIVDRLWGSDSTS